MEELRIKCPSCSIVLDVRNSKNEAVKQIVCPNCKKHLAVTFHDEPKPHHFVDIRMVHLADGSSKTLVRLLEEGHVVKVNGQQLQKDDEVVLNMGDELQVDDAVSIFGKEQETVNEQPIDKAPKPVEPKKSRSLRPFVMTVLSAAILAVAVWLLWPSAKRNQMPAPPVAVADSTVPVPKPADNVAPVKKQPAPQNSDVKRQPSDITPSAPASDYELERQAMSGDVRAQYEIGRRWVSRHDSINVVKGIKYLKLASGNGSSEARQTLNKVYAALRQSALNGNATAENILREQR